MISAGDTVLAYDETTGEVGEYTITDTHIHVDPIIVHLTIDGEIIETTPEHPFYTIDGEWVAAGFLENGDQILSLDGDYGTVESVMWVADPQEMHNLTVEGVHTFAVGDGQWVVHNCPVQPELPNMPPPQLPPGVHSNKFYSVLYEVQLRKDVDFPVEVKDRTHAQQLRLQHNRYANQQLKAMLAEMELHRPSEFKHFKKRFPEIVRHLKKGDLSEAPDG